MGTEAQNIVFMSSPLAAMEINNTSQAEAFDFGIGLNRTDNLLLKVYLVCVLFLRGKKKTKHFLVSRCLIGPHHHSI